MRQREEAIECEWDGDGGGGGQQCDLVAESQISTENSILYDM